MCFGKRFAGIVSILRTRGTFIVSSIKAVALEKNVGLCIKTLIRHYLFDLYRSSSSAPFSELSKQVAGGFSCS